MSLRLRFASALVLLAALSSASRAGDPTSRPELDAVPRDAFIVVHLRPADLWKCELVAKQRQQYPLFAAGLVAELGEDPADTESASLVFPNGRSLEPFLGIDPLRSRQFRMGGRGDDTEPSKAKDKTRADNRFLMIVTTVKPYDRTKVAEMVLGQDSVLKEVKGKQYRVAGSRSRRADLNDALHFVNDLTYVFASPPAWLEKMLDDPAGLRKPGPLSAAIDLAGQNHHVVVGLNMTGEPAQEWKKQVAADVARYNRMEPIWSLLPLFDVTSATAAIDVGKQSRVQASFVFPDARRAQDAESAGQDLLALIRIFSASRAVHQLRIEAEQKDDPRPLLFWMLLARQAESALREGKVESRGSVLSINVQRKFDVDALWNKAGSDAKTLVIDEEARKAVDLARDRFVREVSRNYMRQLVFAMHSFHDVNGTLLPAAICSKKDGKPLLSWRVAILPYVEETALYKQFKLDEPWDSPNNIKLLPKMPQVFLPSGITTKEPHTTYYQAFVGPDAVFRIKPQADNGFGAVGIKLTDIADGTSNTIGIVEAAEAVPWTKPVDLVYDKAKPLPKVGGGLFKYGFHAAFMDGYCGFLSNRIDEATMRALITPAGGEQADWEKYKER